MNNPNPMAFVLKPSPMAYRYDEAMSRKIYDYFLRHIYIGEVAVDGQTFIDYGHIEALRRVFPMPKDPHTLRLLALWKLTTTNLYNWQGVLSIRELYRVYVREGWQVSAAMKHAHCVQMVRETVNELWCASDVNLQDDEAGLDSSVKLFANLARQYWEDDSFLECRGLESSELLQWRDDILGAVSDEGARERLLEKFDSHKIFNVEAAVFGFVADELRSMRPPELEAQFGVGVGRKLMVAAGFVKDDVGGLDSYLRALHEIPRPKSRKKLIL